MCFTFLLICGDPPNDHKHPNKAYTEASNVPMFEGFWKYIEHNLESFYGEKSQSFVKCRVFTKGMDRNVFFVGIPHHYFILPQYRYAGVGLRCFFDCHLDPFLEMI